MHLSLDEEEGKVPEEMVDSNHFMDLLSERISEEEDIDDTEEVKFDIDAFSTNRLDT